MYTAEEIEECDLLPHEVTKMSIIKCFVYSAVVFVGIIFIYSVYNEKDFVSVLTLESRKYSSGSLLYEVMTELDVKYKSYLSDEKKSLNATELSSIIFIEDYVAKSLPLIVEKGLQHEDDLVDDANSENNANDLFNDELHHTRIKDYENILLSVSGSNTVVLEQKDILKKFAHKGIVSLPSSHTKNYEMKSMAKFIALLQKVHYNKIHNIINEDLETSQSQNKEDPMTLSLTLKDYRVYSPSNKPETKENLRVITRIEKWLNDKFLESISVLELNSALFSLGDSMYISKTESDARENILCMLEGVAFIHLTPHLQLNGVYPLKEYYHNLEKASDYKWISPVSLIEPNTSKFPGYRQVNKIQIKLSQGDCLYIPSLWWFQFRTESLDQWKILELKYEGDRLANYIFKGILKEDIN